MLPTRNHKFTDSERPDAGCADMNTRLITGLLHQSTRQTDLFDARMSA